MLRSQEYVNQPLPELQSKLIFNPLELLANQLQSKDLASRKQSIQNVEVIALTMSEKDIVETLFPYLMKTMVEENNKDLKLSIMKSFKNILPLLSKQKSYLQFMQILIQTALVFEQTQIKSEAISILNDLLFGDDFLNFNKFKETIKDLIYTELKQITEPSIVKNAKQLTFHLIKYLFHQSNQISEDEVQEIIEFLKINFIQKRQNIENAKPLSQNLHILVEKWPKNFLSQLDTYICIFSGLQEFLQTEEKPLKLPKQVQAQTKTSVIPSLIQYAKHHSSQKVHSAILKLLEDEDPNIKIGLIKKSKEILQIYKSQDLSAFIDIFRNFSSQSQDIKKAIVQILDQIDLDSAIKNETIMKYCKNTFDLKNVLIQALIKGNKSEQVGLILCESDYDFKVKIFMKLPDSLLHKNESYAQIIDSLLSDMKRNFRSKLNIILNLISRIEENMSKLKQGQKINQVFEISYLIKPLIKYFGDRVAIIRINVAKLYALIMSYYTVDFLLLSKSLEESFYGENKGWFERQNVLIMIKEYIEIKQKFKIKSETHANGFRKKESSEFMSFIEKVLKHGVQGINIKSSEKQTHKVTIKNISLLASQIQSQYSLSQ